MVRVKAEGLPVLGFVIVGLDVGFQVLGLGVEEGEGEVVEGLDEVLEAAVVLHLEVRVLEKPQLLQDHSEGVLQLMAEGGLHELAAGERVRHKQQRHPVAELLHVLGVAHFSQFLFHFGHCQARLLPVPMLVSHLVHLDARLQEVRQEEL